MFHVFKTGNSSALPGSNRKVKFGKVASSQTLPNMAHPDLKLIFPPQPSWLSFHASGSGIPRSRPLSHPHPKGATSAITYLLLL